MKLKQDNEIKVRFDDNWWALIELLAEENGGLAPAVLLRRWCKQKAKEEAIAFGMVTEDALSQVQLTPRLERALQALGVDANVNAQCEATDRNKKIRFRLFH